MRLLCSACLTITALPCSPCLISPGENRDAACLVKSGPGVLVALHSLRLAAFLHVARLMGPHPNARISG